MATMNFMYHILRTKLNRRFISIIVIGFAIGMILYHNQEETFYFFPLECSDNLTKLQGQLPSTFNDNYSVINITKTRTELVKIKGKKYCYVSTSLSRRLPVDEEKFTDVLFSNVSQEMRYLGFDDYGECDGEKQIIPSSIPTIISAVSRNNYNELAALCKNMNATLRRRFPKIVFVVYNLETSKNSDVKALAHYCGCEIRDFPFSRFPKHVRILTGYTWKPLVISMALREFPFVMWLDASIRFNPERNISRLWDRARHCHIQMLSTPGWSVGETSDIATMRFLRQNETEYMHTTGIGAGFGIFLRTKFLMERVIRPWDLCAMSYGCMITDTYKHQTQCRKQKPKKAGICHRFEQTVLSIILSKLYGKSYEQLLVKEREFGSIARGQTIRYH